MQDVEWAASDKPVMACSNGCLIISHYSREKLSDLTPIVSLQQSSSGGGGGGGGQYATLLHACVSKETIF